MTRTHENKLTMYLALQTYLANNAAKTGTLPALASLVTHFSGQIDKIKAKSLEFSQASTGKSQLRLASLPAAGRRLKLVKS